MSDTIAETKYGKLDGSLEKGVYIWRGIPYAQTPERFKTAKECLPFEGVREAKKFGGICPQVASLIKEGQTESEDCLYLNVYSPDKNGKAPVLLFIHGGAFVFGSGSTFVYDGSALAAKGVVVVTINYRFGPFGNFNFSFLNDGSETDGGFASNIVLHDQATALKWVYENISAFGGDPDNITLSGQSAGAISVMGLINAPSVAAYYNKAVILSVFPGMFMTNDESIAAAKRFMEYLGVSTKEELAAYPAKKLTKKTGKYMLSSGHLWGTQEIRLVADGEFLPELPMVSARKGNDSHVPILFGTTDNEADVIFGLPFIKKEAYKEIAYMKQYNKDILPIIETRYTDKKNLKKIGTDFQVKAPTEAYALAHAKHAPVWLYRFCYAPVLLNVTGVHAVHAFDLLFLFNTYNKKISRLLFPFSSDKKRAAALAERYQNDMIEFFKTGACTWGAFDGEYTTKLYGSKTGGTEDEVETSVEKDKEDWVRYFANTVK
ncbi:MAG: carboxylesterase family protein [Clostridiales bacterium]|jgi:para-nitrobenzyl esterase|nr:carboxylesterase family protein [Clostridiales bacterium]